MSESIPPPKAVIEAWGGGATPMSGSICKEMYSKHAAPLLPALHTTYRTSTYNMSLSAFRHNSLPDQTLNLKQKVLPTWPVIKGLHDGRGRQMHTPCALPFQLPPFSALCWPFGLDQRALAMVLLRC